MRYAHVNVIIISFTEKKTVKDLSLSSVLLFQKYIPATIYKIFETNCNFHKKQRTTGKV